MEKRQFGIPAIALGFTALTLTGCLVEEKEDEDEDCDEDEEDCEGEDEDDDGGGGGGGGDGIDGSWSLTSLSSADYGEMDLEYSGSYEGEYGTCDYTYSTGFTMTVSGATVGMDIEYYSYNSCDGAPYSYSDTYSGSVTDNGSTYGIDFTDWISMDCSLSGDNLSCDSTGSYAGYSLEFER